MRKLVLIFFWVHVWVVLLHCLYMEDLLIIKLKNINSGDFIKLCCKNFCSLLQYNIEEKIFLIIQKNPILFECTNDIVVYSSTKNTFHFLTVIKVQFDKLIEFIDPRGKEPSHIYFWSPFFELVQVEQEQKYMYQPLASFHKAKHVPKDLGKRTYSYGHHILKQCKDEKKKCKLELMDCMKKQQRGKEVIHKMSVICNVQSDEKAKLINRKINNIDNNDIKKIFPIDNDPNENRKLLIKKIKKPNIKNRDLSKEIFNHFHVKNKRKAQMNNIFNHPEDGICTPEKINTPSTKSSSIIEKIFYSLKNINKTNTLKNKIMANPILLFFLKNHRYYDNFNTHKKQGTTPKENISKFNFLYEQDKENKTFYWYFKDVHKEFFVMILIVMLILILFFFTLLKKKMFKVKEKTESHITDGYLESEILKIQKNSFSHTRVSGRLAEIHVEHNNKIQTNIGSKIKDITDEDLINLIAFNKAETIVICQP